MLDDGDVAVIYYRQDKQRSGDDHDKKRSPLL